MAPAITSPSRKTGNIIAVLLIGFIVVFLFGLRLGAITITPIQCLAILVSKIGIILPIKFESQQALVLWEIRLPRVIGACLVGSALGMAGAAMQGLFRNPLADPGLVGVSSGAALGAVLCLIMGPLLSFAPNLFVPWAAFIGALLTAWIASHLAQKEKRTVVSTLLLAGIALNAICGAAVGLLTFLATDVQLRSIIFWNLGSLGGITWHSVGWLVSFIFPASVGLLSQQHTLNILLLGEAEGSHLGFPVEKSKRIILLCTTLIVGAAVSFAGMIAFVGLVVPHLLRLWGGPDHRFLLPGSAVLGALLLVLSDTAARLLVQPAELPIGIVTAFCGAPFFLWLLQKEKCRL